MSELVRNIPFNELTSFISLSPLFSDNMIFQRDVPTRIFGKGVPDKKLIIIVDDNDFIITINDSGDWETNLIIFPAVGPYSLQLIFQKEIIIKNIVVGDVFLCSGQSNMEMQLDGWGRVNNFREEITNAEYPNIRLFKVNQNVNLNEQENIQSSGWKECRPESVTDFSAVAYFFAKNLIKEIDVPIGLIQSTWSGSPIEAWMSEESLSVIKKNSSILNDLQNKAKSEKKLKDKFLMDYREWESKFFAKETFVENGSLDINNNDNWIHVDLPYMWQENEYSDFNGSVWFRKTIQIPDEVRNDLYVNLGPIKDQYTLWFNGNLIKEVSPIEFIREHKIPAKLVKTENEIVVRVFAEMYGGGFWGEKDEIKIYSSNGYYQLISDDWLAAKGVDIDKIEAKPKNPVDIDVPTVLYNAMIYPLKNFNIKGFFWYQGESNVFDPVKYEEYFKLMIKDWREKFGSNDLPFIFIQLANYVDLNDESNESWAKLREAQESVLSLPNTGMVCTIDVGELDDIHPSNKQDVGKRAALIAQKLIYKQAVISEGPRLKDFIIVEDRAIVEMKITDDNLFTKDGLSVREFYLSGNDRKFYNADVIIDNNRLVISNKKIKNPVAVRYAWTNNPDCNLTDNSNLPALPFRTDNW